MRHCFAGTPPHTAAQTSGNRIKRLPEAIGKLSKLEVLNLTSNQLTQLPSSIGRLRRCVAVCVCAAVCDCVVTDACASLNRETLQPRSTTTPACEPPAARSRQ